MNEYFFLYFYFYVGRIFCVIDISRRKSDGRYQISLNKHFTTRQESRRTETCINKFFHVNIKNKYYVGTNLNIYQSVDGERVRVIRSHI